jgi:hypothetical protein
MTLMAGFALIDALAYCSDTPYLGKYLQSKEPCAAAGNELPTAIVKHTLVQYARAHIGSQRTAAGGIGKLSSRHKLYTPLAVLGKVLASFDGRDNGISDELRRKLDVYLQLWKRDVNRQDTELLKTLELLTWLPENKRHKRSKETRLVAKGQYTCGFPECEVQGAELKICSR